MFVAFEGIDGSGKTTISNLVAERLSSRGLSVAHMRSKGRFASSVSEAIRALARDSTHLDLVPEAEFLLYLAREVQLIHERLRPALAQNDVVITDRCHVTAEVLGHSGRHLSQTWVHDIANIATADVQPDLVVLVDVDPSLARARRKAAKARSSEVKAPSRKGLAGVGLQHRLRRGYLEQAARAPERWAVIDNDAELARSVERVVELIVAALREGAAAALSDFRSSESTAMHQRNRRVESPQHALQELIAWVDRRRRQEPHVAAYVLGGLWGEPIDVYRRELSRVAPEVVLAGLSGLDDATSWDIRERLQSTAARAVARSLRGVPSSDLRGAALRARFERELPVEVMLSLAGDDGPAAWALRERLFPEHAAAVIASLGRIEGERARALRESWLERQGERLVQQPDLLRDALRSVNGLDHERAWQLRDVAAALAPVAAINSIVGLTSERSWRWRERHLARATKVVMRTLRQISDERAWAMRASVAADCKEAIDGIQGMDDAAAWMLRERYADVWPSTVVKTLGPLANDPRGRDLLERQLAGYPENLSLLKHAAAIALGAFAVAPIED
jgi:dTMP kinase